MRNIVFQTVLSGTLVFVFGQIIQIFIISPVKEFKGVIGKLDNELKYHENVLVAVFRPSGGIPNNILLESLKITRRLSCDLESIYKQIPFKSFFVFCNIIPVATKVSDVATRLIRLSNAGGNESYIDNNLKDINQIRISLNIVKL